MNSEAIKSLPENHWFEIAKKLYEQKPGTVPDPLQIRASAIIDALGLPSGEVSALGTDERGERTNTKKDRIIAEYLTNKPGVVIDQKTGIVSTDFRDIYPDGLPEELASAIDPDTRAIMDSEYEHERYTRKKFGDTKDRLQVDCPTNYFRLPGGVDLFLRGYVHDRDWQENHGSFLQKANTRARVICIEGIANKPFGNGLDSYWNYPDLQFGHYDRLMHEAVGAGFNGFFTEVDARDESKITMDATGSFHFPNLPESFFHHYFAFFQREHPRLAEMIGSSENLRRALQKQSTTWGAF